MTIYVQMLDFLRSANLGGIKLGMNRQELRELLGDPPDWSVTPRRKRAEIAAIWKYGSIEFYFADWTDILYMIFSDQFPFEGCETLHLDPWELKEALPLEGALQLLDGAHLKYHFVKDANLGATYVSLESGVRLSFHPPYDDGPLWLTGFSLHSTI